MTTTRKQHRPKFKAMVAVEIRGERTLSQLASQYHVHPVQIGQSRALLEAHPLDGYRRQILGESAARESAEYPEG